MSRIAKNAVLVPPKVDVTLTDDEITVKGPLGELKQKLTARVKVTREGDQLRCSMADESREANAMSGTVRALIANMVKGVSSGFEKKLSLVGVGYRAQAKGDVLNMALGFSHPVDYKLPSGIKAETPTQTEVVIKGIDKQRVGQVAAEIRAFRKPEPYKGKGVRYVDEVIQIKETKKK